jgi:hypothetical protein
LLCLFCRKKEKEACELMVRRLLFLYDDLIYKRWTEF